MIWSVVFLLFVGVTVPVLAASSYRQLAAAGANVEDLPSAKALAFQTLVLQALLLSLAVMAARGRSLDIPWSGEWATVPMLAALGVLVLALSFARWEARRPLGPADALRKLLRSQGITTSGVVVMVAAAIAEEVAYRGVLFLLLADFMPPLAAAAGSAVLFGLGHSAQGPRGALASAVVALAMQAICYLSGGLLLAIVTHFLYDLGVAWLARKL